MPYRSLNTYSFIAKYSLFFSISSSLPKFLSFFFRYFFLNFFLISFSFVFFMQTKNLVLTYLPHWIKVNSCT